MALNAEEKRLVKAAFHQGPSAFIDAEWPWDRIQRVVHDPEAVEVWNLLKREFDIHEGLRARGKFVATRNLHAMIDSASAVLLAALAGPEYARDAQNRILRDALNRPILMRAEMTPTQLRAAVFVLEGSGVSDHRLQGDSASDPSLKLLFAGEESKVVIDDDPDAKTDEARSLSRERVRNALLKLAPRVMEARATVKKSTGIDPAKDTSVARRKQHKKDKARTKVGASTRVRSSG